MDELVESDLLRKVRIIPYSEKFLVHPILHESLVGPDDDRDNHRYHYEIGGICSEKLN
jgi:hypothetical protein